MEDIEDDDIIREVRANREAIAARFNHDIGALCRYLREKEKESGQVYLQPPARSQTSAEGAPVAPPDTGAVPPPHSAAA